MTDHTDEQQLKLIQSIDPLAVRVPPGVSKIIEHFNALRQQDLARMARMREALEILSAKSDWCASIAEPVLSETSDIQDWMDGKRAQWISAGLNKPKESDGEVLVLMPDGRREIAWASYWHGASNDFARWSFRDPDETDIPTHWMPLPAAPSARSTKGEG